MRERLVKEITDPIWNMRLYLAWKRKHPTEKPILKVKTKGKTAKKAIADAVSSIAKDLDKTLADFKRM